MIDAFDVTFAGFGGQPIKAWLTRPAGRRGDLPAVVEFIGYGGGRGFAHERLAWAAAGYVHLVMDTRGQGSTWGGGGDTPGPGGLRPGRARRHDARASSTRTSYYYRRLITDAVRAVDAVRALPGVDPARVAVTGGSQGGGLAIAVGRAGRRPRRRDARRAVPVPLPAGARRSPTRFPYGEIVQLPGGAPRPGGRRPAHAVVRRRRALRARGRRRRRCSRSRCGTRRARRRRSSRRTTTTPGCRPATGDAIEVYAYNQHEGGQAFQVDRQLRWLRSLLAQQAAPASADALA